MSNPNTTETTWKSQAGYVWSLIGSAVGFANILSFSAQVYKNGGGAFLIPYCIALFTLGIPLLILEGIVGSRKKLPLVPAYGSEMGQIGKTLGWLAVIACLSIGGFYVVLTGYSVAYTYFSAFNLIPEDSAGFFLNSFLKISPSISEFGGISWGVLIPTLAVIAVSYFVLVQDIRNGIEKVCSIFMPILAVIMTIFAIAVTLLPGGIDGWVYYLKPNFDRLYDPNLWRDVFGQLFFSLSLGLGIIVGYSRYTGQNANIGKAMIYVAMGDFAVSFIAGAAIFGCLAHISFVQGVPFESILNTDSTFEIGFILFPQMLKFFGPFVAQVVGTIFFFCVFIAGITGVFSIAESIAGNIEVEFKTSRKFAVKVTSIAFAALSLIFCMGNASHLIDALVPMVIGTNMLIGGLALILVFQYASKDIKNDPVWKMKGSWTPFAICLRYVAPIVLGTILIGNLAEEFQGFDLAKAVRWTWFILALTAATYLSKRVTSQTQEHVLAK